MFKFRTEEQWKSSIIKYDRNWHRFVRDIRAEALTEAIQVLDDMIVGGMPDSEALSIGAAIVKIADARNAMKKGTYERHPKN